MTIACALERRLENDLARGLRTSARARVYVRATCACAACALTRPEPSLTLSADEEWAFAALLRNRERARQNHTAKLAVEKAKPAPPALEAPRGWCSKVRHAGGNPAANSVAHFLDRDGPACSKLIYEWKGIGPGPAIREFACSWGPHQVERDHLCSNCRRMRDTLKECRCGKCRVRPRNP